NKILILLFVLAFFNIFFAYRARAEKTCECAENVCMSIADAEDCPLGCSDGSCTPNQNQSEAGPPLAPMPTILAPITAPATSKSPDPVKLENPIGSTDIPTIIGTLIRGAMGIMGALVLLMFVWGGFTWLTSGGVAEKVKKGTQTIVWAVIGAAITLSSYIILNTILELLAGK
ncbi:pilin, partial [Patescibacteria group bacterium]|nr:pilin [Patescibacteria group bacterium]